MASMAEPMRRVVAAPDKFRGTASAAEIAAAIVAAVDSASPPWTGQAVPMADGGEGTLDALGGPNRESEVTGPLATKVRAPWRLRGAAAYIEMARASGLELAGGAEGNDPMAASTAGVGELIVEAVEHGARRIMVTLGGSATTDGGLGAIQAIGNVARLRGVELIVACDVSTRFVDAARVFGPQKGASPAQVKLLTGRLSRLVQVYEERFGVDVSELPGGGAAGGLAGALAALGARLAPGFDVVAEEVGLDEALEGASLVVTGEGYLDDQSLEGKVVGGVLERAARLGVEALVICGDADSDVVARLGSPVVSLVERFGTDAAFARTADCVQEAMRRFLAG